MDGMFLGIAALFRDILSEEPDPTIVNETPSTTELITSTLSLLTTETVTNSTNETIAIIIVEPAEEEDTMHYSTATGLAVTGLLVLICVALFALCFLLRKYCRCAYDLHYNLSYGKVPKGAVLVPNEDQLEAGELSKRSTLNVGADSGIGYNSRHASEPQLVRPSTPSQRRPPRPAPMKGGSLQRTAAEQRPLLPSETGTLAVEKTGLYPSGEIATSHHVEETLKTDPKE